MVNINLTLFIELALFLIFLWGAARFILRPALTVIDERDDRIERDQAEAQARGRDADSIEKEYQAAIAVARTDAQRRYFETQARAMDANAARLTEARRQVDAAVARTRESGAAELEEQRRELVKAAPDVAEELARRLGLGSAGR